MSAENNLQSPLQTRFPLLQSVFERFSRQLKLRLFTKLRKNIEVQFASQSRTTLPNYTLTYRSPSLTWLFTQHTVSNYSAITLPPDTAYLLVDLAFGGSGEFKVIAEDREFSGSEISVLRRGLLWLTESLEEAWQGVQPIKIERIRAELQPQNFRCYAPHEILVQATFHLSLNNQKYPLHLLIPETELESIAGQLQNLEQLQEGFQPLEPQEVTSEENPVAAIEALPIDVLKEFLTGEHPQIIAFVLSFLNDVKKATGVLKGLPEELKADVLYRVSSMKYVSQDVRDEALATLAQEAQMITEEPFEHYGGLKLGRAILHSFKPEEQKEAVQQLEAWDRTLAQKLQDLGAEPDPSKKQFHN